MALLSRLLQRARTLWHGPSSAPSLPRGAGGGFRQRIAVLWRGPVPSPPRRRQAGRLFLDRVSRLWRGPTRTLRHRCASCAAAGTGPLLPADSAFHSTSTSPPSTIPEAFDHILTELKLLRQKMDTNSGAEMRWFKRIHELLMLLAVASGLTLKECIEELMQVWEESDAEMIEYDPQHCEIESWLGGVPAW